MKTRFGESVDMETVEKAKKWGDITPNGISFGYDLCCSGAMFGLYIESHHTEKDIEDAKKFLLNERDVVSFVLRKVEDK